MKIDNYKPTKSSGAGSYNIKYCPVCGKYQHFKRVKHSDGYRDFCGVCKYKKEVK